MTWREDLRRVIVDGKQLIGASFRGASFFVESSERSGGRRVVVHEFPLRNDPFVEDLGRKARSFRVDGYVIGDGYIAKRDALLSALEDASGPGELVHPYHGVRRAVPVSVAVRETRAEGGIAMFAIEFAEAPAQAPTPVEVVDSVEVVGKAADGAIAAAKAELVQRYSAARLPAFALESAENALIRASNGLEAALAPVATKAQELAALRSRVALITARASSLARSPSDAFDGFREAATALSDAAITAPWAVLDAVLDAYEVDLGESPPATTSTRQRELVNHDALTGALRRVIAVEAARLAPRVPFPTIEDATATRDQVAVHLADQAGGADDAAYPALVNLRANLLRAVPGGATFARIVPAFRPVAVSSLVLAHQLYGAVNLEADIIARNRVRHPGFISGDLRVLSNG